MEQKGYYRKQTADSGGRPAASSARQALTRRVSKASRASLTLCAARQLWSGQRAGARTVWVGRDRGTDTTSPCSLFHSCQLIVAKKQVSSWEVLLACSDAGADFGCGY